MSIVLYLYRSAKFDVVVFKASMFGLTGGTSAKFGITIFKASMLECLDQSTRGICASAKFAKFSGAVQGIYAQLTGG